MKEAALEWPKRVRCACSPIQRDAVCFERADGAGLKRVSDGGSGDKVRFIRTAAVVGFFVLFCFLGGGKASLHTVYTNKGSFFPAPPAQCMRTQGRGSKVGLPPPQ